MGFDADGLVLGSMSPEGGKLIQLLSFTSCYKVIFEQLAWQFDQASSLQPQCKAIDQSKHQSDALMQWNYLIRGQGTGFVRDYAEQLFLKCSFSKLGYVWLKKRFLRMPKSQKDKIYRELETLLIQVGKGEKGCGEDAFYERRSFTATPGEIAQAIKNYLARRASPI